VGPPAEEEALLRGRDEQCGSAATPHQPGGRWRSNPRDDNGSCGGYPMSPLLCGNSSVLLRPTVAAGTVRSCILDCTGVSPWCPNEDWLGSSSDSGSESGICRAGSRPGGSSCDSRKAKRCSRIAIAFANWRPKTACKVFCPRSLASRSPSS